MSRLILTIFLVFTFQAWAHDQSSVARYLGNEGVIVNGPSTAVLFDAFYAESYGSYLLIDKDVENAMLDGKPPYDMVKAIFVSHVHGDHFSVTPARKYLRKHPTIKLYASGQVIDALTEGTGDEFDQQLLRFDLKPGETTEMATEQGYSVAVASIPHAGGDRQSHIENLVFRIALEDGPVVVHLGDAAVDTTLFRSVNAFFDEVSINIAFPPYWFFQEDEGREILKTIVKATQTVGIHVPAEARGNGDEWRTRVGGDLFTDPGEIRKIP